MRPQIGIVSVRVAAHQTAGLGHDEAMQAVIGSDGKAHRQPCRCTCVQSCVKAKKMMITVKPMKTVRVLPPMVLCPTHRLSIFWLCGWVATAHKT